MPDGQSQGDQGGAGNGNAAGVGLGTQNAGAGNQGGAALNQGQSGGDQGGSKPWFDGLVKDADNLKTIETTKWDSADAAIKSYRELQKALSSKSGASSQAPADPKEYSFNVPDDMKQGYNQAFADGFRQWAHKAGLSKEAAATVHDEFVKFAKDTLTSQSKASGEALGETVTKAQTELEKAWGAMVTPAFKRNLEMAKRAIGQLDPALMDELRDVGAIVKVGNDEMIAKPALFKALAKVGGQLYAEDTLYGDAAKVANPFDPKTTDMKMQNHIVRTDPEKAKLLIRAANQEAMWQHFLNP